MFGMKRNKDVAKAIFREESSGHNNKAASDVLDDGILTQDDPGVNMHSDRDPDAVKVNQILQKQNAELRETVGYLKELVRLQGKVTDGTVYTRGSVEAAARKLIRGVNAKGNVRQRGLAELRRVFLLPQKDADGFPQGLVADGGGVKVHGGKGKLHDGACAEGTDQGADAHTEQGDGWIQTGQRGDKDRGAKHCEDMLDAQGDGSAGFISAPEQGFQFHSESSLILVVHLNYNTFI